MDITETTPWTLDLDDARDINGMVFVAIKDKNGVPVAMVPVLSMDSKDEGFSKTHVEIARLIAAAPRMFKALAWARWHLMTKARKDLQERQIVDEINATLNEAGLET